MDMVTLKKSGYALLLLSLLYFVPAVFLYLASLGQMFFPAGNHPTIRQSFALLHQRTGDGFFGLLVVILIGAFGYMVSLKDPIKQVAGNTESVKGFKRTQLKRRERMYAVFGRFIMMNLVLSFIWFGYVQDQIGGHIHYGPSNDCYVTYRGEFKRAISLEQAHQYRFKSETSVSYLVSSLVLGGTGFLFILVLQLVLVLRHIDDNFQLKERP